MIMSISYEQSGRTAQKARTRKALLDATRALLADGISPTVEQAADAASISRATAYRYFPNQRALLIASYPEIGETSLLPDPAPSDPALRLDAVAESITRQVLEHEAELRANLRIALEDPHGEVPLRRGRRIGWVEDALSPLRGQLPKAKLDRLVLAICAALGIEALIWLTDMAGLSRKDAVASMRWSARALLQAALAEG